MSTQLFPTSRTLRRLFATWGAALAFLGRETSCDGTTLIPFERAGAIAWTSRANHPWLASVILSVQHAILHPESAEASRVPVLGILRCRCLRSRGVLHGGRIGKPKRRASMTTLQRELLRVLLCEPLRRPGLEPAATSTLAGVLIQIAELFECSVLVALLTRWPIFVHILLQFLQLADSLDFLLRCLVVHNGSYFVQLVRIPLFLQAQLLFLLHLQFQIL